MKYLYLAGIVIAAWVLNWLIGMAFCVYTKGAAKTYEQLLVDNGNNIFVYGLFGVGGLFLGDLFGGWISYVILGIGVIIVLVGIVPLVLMFLTTIPLTLSRSHSGIANSGKLSDWIFFASRLTENAIMVYLVFRMYIDFI